MTTDTYAAQLASILAGSWPRARISDETCLVWARLFEPERDDVAEAAVDKASSFEGPPSKIELQTVIRAARETLVPELPLSPIETGRTITLEEWHHGRFHLDRYFRTGATRDLRDPEEFARAERPWECSCDDWSSWDEPADLNVIGRVVP